MGNLMDPWPVSIISSRASKPTTFILVLPSWLGGGVDPFICHSPLWKGSLVKHPNKHPYIGFYVPCTFQLILVGGWTNPIWKILIKMVNLPQILVKLKKIWNHHLVMYWCLIPSNENEASINIDYRPMYWCPLPWGVVIPRITNWIIPRCFDNHQLVSISYTPWN